MTKFEPVRHGPLAFAPIDLARTSALCLAIRVDSYVVSWGYADDFYGADGKGAERYLSSLADRLETEPWSVVHASLADDIVGQVEIGRAKADPAVGFINLYYLLEGRRDAGLGRWLDDYAMDYLRGQGIRRARLSVSPSNGRAIRFYERIGWRATGERAGPPEVDHPEVLYMGRDL